MNGNRHQTVTEKNFNAARKFAVQGMHLEWYTGNVVELYLYSKYFWYLEISRATIALGAYLGDELVGVLRADMDDEPKVFANCFYRSFVRIAEFLRSKPRYKRKRHWNKMVK